MLIPVGTGEAAPRQKFSIITVTIVALNSLVFLFELSLLFMEGEQALSK